MTRALIVTGVALGLMVGGIQIGKGPAPQAGKLAPQTEARCPLIYAPVQCDHGKVYPNQCVADQHHAKNCVPIGV
jgi:hypothetical protein